MNGGPPTLPERLYLMNQQLVGEVGSAGWCYLFLIGAFLPYAAIKSRFKMARRPNPKRTQHFRSVILTQCSFAALALMVAEREYISLWRPLLWSTADIAIAAIGLVACVVAVFPLWRRSVLKRARILHIFMPRTLTERLLWGGASLAAGVCEEIVYRGVLFVLLARLLHNPWLAAIAAAVIFGLGHLVQSLLSCAIILLFSLAFQYLTWRTGSLYLAMAVHFSYDLIAGITYGWLGAKYGYPAEGLSVAVDGSFATHSPPVSESSGSTN